MDISWIVANMEAFEAGKRYLVRPSSSSDNWFLLIAILAIVLLWAILYHWDKFRKKFARQRNDNPQILFIELCKVHALSYAERALLRKAIEVKKLAQPAMLFVDPDLLSGMSASGSPEAPDYAKLVRKLFGEETFQPELS